MCLQKNSDSKPEKNTIIIIFPHHLHQFYVLIV